MKNHSWRKINTFSSNVGSFTKFTCDNCEFGMLIESENPEDIWSKWGQALLGAQELPLRDCEMQKVKIVIEG